MIFGEGVPHLPPPPVTVDWICESASVCSINWFHIGLLLCLWTDITFRRSDTCMYWRPRNASWYHVTLTVIKRAMLNWNLTSRSLSLLT